MPLPLLIAAGVAAGAAGSLLGGNQAKKTRKRIEDAANQPGLDTGAITDAALTDLEKYLPRDIALAEKVTEANQGILNKLYKDNVPGFENIQQQRSSLIQDFLAGKLPDDVQSAVERSSAARGLGLGISGSGIGRNLTARDLGRTSLDLMNLGLRETPGFFASTPIADPTNPLAFAGPTPMQLIGIRGQERETRQNLLAQAAGAGGSTGVWGNFLSQMGGLATGFGLMGGGGSLTGQPSAAGRVTGGGGSLPGNWSAMSMSQQNQYGKAFDRYAHVNSSLYE